MGTFIRRLAATGVAKAFVASPASEGANRIVRRRSLAPIAALAALSLGLAACSSSSPSSTTAGSGGSSAATGVPVKIALVTSLTGAASAQFQTAPAGFLAAVAAQNAMGGINGHKIVGEVLDDQSSPTQTALVIQKAISDGNIGIVADSSLFFLGAKYAQQAGIPVTGGSFDGPEWGTQPYTNMFASDVGSVNPSFPVNTFDGAVLKAHGGTTLGTFGYSISPQSTYATYGAAKSAELVGLKAPVVDASVPYGTESFGTEALSAKSGGIDSLVANMDNNSNFALLTAIKQEGVNLKAVFFPAGYDQSLIGSNVWQALQGSVFGTTFRPFQIPHNSGITAMQNALMKYQGWKSAEFPTFGQYESYIGAMLMMQGIQLAGSSPTPTKVISSLRHKVTAWNANGIDAITTNYATNFGTSGAKTCEWTLQAKANGFVPLGSTPLCGVFVKGTTSKTP
jgi:branched-chain amino acid transport system substrate-binding protein